MHPPKATARRRGQSLVELALILPILTVLMVGSVDLARVFYVKVTVANASRVAAQYAANSAIVRSMYGGCPIGWTDARREECAKKNATTATKAMAAKEAASIGLTTNEVKVEFLNAAGNWTQNPDWTTVWQPGDRYKVTVTATFSPITPMAGTLLGTDALPVTHFTELRHHCARESTCNYQ